MHRAALKPLVDAFYALAARLPATPPPAVLERFCDGLSGLSPGNLDRLAPYDLATELGLDREVVVDLCVIAARAGLLEFSYHLFCLGCGAAEYAFGALDQVASGSYFCTVCRRDRPTDLDDRVEVVLRPGPSLELPRPDPYTDLAAYRRRFFSPHLHFAPPVTEALASGARGFVVLAPGESTHRLLDLPASQAIQALSLDAHIVGHITAADADPEPTEPTSRSFEITPAGLADPDQEAPPGRVRLGLINRREHPVGIILRCLDWAHVRALYLENPPTVGEFLSARDLLTHQRFVELFGATATLPELRLQIRDLTLLFTDLRGSTPFYVERGDFAAYYVVREHFSLLMEIVRRHRGAVIKTMGDAIMAAFRSPRDAVAASLAIHRAWQPWADTGLPALKAGLHRGSALVVNANGAFDYFGQAVNLAAATQSFADGGELWLTAAVFESPGVTDTLRAEGPLPEPKRIMLKGQTEPSVLYRVFVRRDEPREPVAAR